MTEKTTRKSPQEHIPEDVREHMRAARDEMRKSVEGMLPPEFVEHRRAARKDPTWKRSISCGAGSQHEGQKERRC